MKVSVIIPIYNGSRYIAECIKSVQEQMLKEIEILCVDDGSTDGSLQILRQMQEYDERIHIFEQENQGAGSARNLALRNASGEFVCFLDADDHLMSDGALGELYHAAVAQHVSVCGGQFYTDDGNRIEQVPIYGRLLNGAGQGRIVDHMDHQQDFYFSAYLYSRRLLQEQGIFFPPYRQFEDPPFCVRALFAAKKIYIMDVPFYCYRIGYKERVYNGQIAYDQIKGMTDDLIFSGQNGLKRLHRITYHRLVNSCRRELRFLYQAHDAGLMELLEEAEKAICWEWLEERCRIQERTLQMSCRILERAGGALEWPFPYDGLEQGERIALYGAGEVGRSYHGQLKEDGRFLLAAWADRNADRIREVDGCTIVAPECLQGIPFDHIIIAVADMLAALEIMDLFGPMDIDPVKVIWDLGR